MKESEDDLRLMYDGLDWSNNLEDSIEDGRTTTTIHPDYQTGLPCLFRIDQMVREIAQSDDTGFVITYSSVGKPDVARRELARKYYDSLNAFLGQYSDRVIYSPHVEVFYDACEALRITPRTFLFGKPLAYVTQEHGDRYADLFNQLISKIRGLCDTRRFKTKLQRRERNARRNEAKGLALEANMYDWKSRHLILMLHFGYKPEHRSAITLKEIQTHRDRFLNNRRMNRLLRGINGFIWKIEQGEKTGLHLHVLIFYSPKSQRDVFIAKKIGEYWVNVVTLRGKGAYWNSNADKRRHAKYGHGVGTGEIDRTADQKREALRENIRYLAKSDQYLLETEAENSHTFGTSQPRKKKKAGRPRVVTPKRDANTASNAQVDSVDGESLGDAVVDQTH